MPFFRKKNVRETRDYGPSGYEIAASIQTDVGCIREVNEDSGRLTQPADPTLITTKGVLAVVCDGMGGHASGEVASRLAVDVISRNYYDDRKSPTEALKRAIENANAEIYTASLEDEDLYGMGTTCAALVLHDGQAFAAHVGDSRVYMLRDGQLYQMTEDHSAVVEMVKHGLITAEEARTHEDKNVILRALGTGPEVEVSTWDQPMSVRHGDQFILCSDGLYDMVEDGEIKTIATTAADPHEACEQLVSKARAAGGHDNITVGIIKIHPSGYSNKQEIRATRELEVTG